MKLSALMANVMPRSDFEGWVTADDWVLAVDLTQDKNADPAEYTVVQTGVAGLDAQLNPVSQEKTYLRAGQSTIKTGTQRVFKITGDRYIGDEFQDYALSVDIRYGVGQTVVVPYLYFCVLNGQGEQGMASLLIHSDGSGNAGESAGIDIELKKTGGQPESFTYSA